MREKNLLDPEKYALELAVLQQFRRIYGCMRQHFRLLEEQCGLPGSQAWIIQEVQRSPEIGISALAARLGIHQSTCSSLVEKLVVQGYLLKQKHSKDQRRVGLSLSEQGWALCQRFPGPAEGILPQALNATASVVLNTLKINLDELIGHLPADNAEFARTPLAEMLHD